MPSRAGATAEFSAVAAVDAFRSPPMRRLGLRTTCELALLLLILHHAPSALAQENYAAALFLLNARFSAALSSVVDTGLLTTKSIPVGSWPAA